MKHLSIRINEELLHKLHIAANHEGRSANAQVNVLIKMFVQEHESRFGEIVLNGHDKGVVK